MTALTDARLRVEIASAFIVGLASSLSADQFRELRQRNAAETHLGVCHSHDFLDANMVMAAAFEKVMGRESDPASEDDAAIWNDAWGLASRDLGGSQQ